MRVPIGKAADFVEGKLKTVNANGLFVVVARTGDGFCAAQGRCSHMPLPLNGGKVEGDVITCPWHNSQYNLCTGENLDWVVGVAGVKLPAWSRRLLAMGKKPQPLKTYTVIEDNGELFVEL